MTIELQNPQHITTLRDCAMQGGVQVRMWLGEVGDESLSDEITQAKRAERGAAKVVKNLLVGCPEHDAIKRARSHAYNWFKQKSFPYAGSLGLIPNFRITSVLSEFDNTIKPDFISAVDKFMVAYADLKSNHAFTMQGKMYNANDYPDPEVVRSRFDINLFIQPIPESDFANRMYVEVADQLSQHYAAQAEQFVRETGERQLAQLSKVMQSLSHCCDIDVREEAGQTKVTRRRLHESTLEKAIEYCDTFKHFNPSGDTRLEGIREGLERALRGVSIDTLRQSDTMRATVKTEVDDLMKKFGL